MPSYTYKARDSAGNPVKGTLAAADREEVVEKLKKLGYTTTYLSEAGARLGAGAASILDRFQWISTGDRLIFYIQLSNMINAGISILASLSTLAKQIENKKLKATVADVAKRVEGGSSLSQAFAAHPAIFSRLFINMIKAGEASGSLDTVLLRYVMFFEKQEDLNQKVRGALFYPIILLCAGVTVSLFIVTFVIPQFAVVYAKSGVMLPIPTLIMLTIGTAIKRFWYLLILACAGIFMGIRYYAGTERGTHLIDTLKLKLPVVGPLYRKIVIARFARTLATVTGSGIPILTALDITKEVAGNIVIERVIENAQVYVEKGERIAEPLKMSGEFPEDVVQMVLVGEETGSLDKMLNKVADFYDMAVDYAVKKLTVVIEPFFLLILGGMVGLIMASMLLPIFDMAKTIRH